GEGEGVQGWEGVREGGDWEKFFLGEKIGLARKRDRDRRRIPERAVIRRDHDTARKRHVLAARHLESPHRADDRARQREDESIPRMHDSSRRPPRTAAPC